MRSRTLNLLGALTLAALNLQAQPLGDPEFVRREVFLGTTSLFATNGQGNLDAIVQQPVANPITEGMDTSLIIHRDDFPELMSTAYNNDQGGIIDFERVRFGDAPLTYTADSIIEYVVRNDADEIVETIPIQVFEGDPVLALNETSTSFLSSLRARDLIATFGASGAFRLHMTTGPLSRVETTLATFDELGVSTRSIDIGGEVEQHFFDIAINTNSISGAVSLGGGNVFDVLFDLDDRVTALGFAVVNYNNFQNYQGEDPINNPSNPNNNFVDYYWTNLEGSTIVNRIAHTGQQNSVSNMFFGMRAPEGHYLTRIVLRGVGRTWRIWNRIDDMGFVVEPSIQAEELVIVPWNSNDAIEEEDIFEGRFRAFANNEPSGFVYSGSAVDALDGLLDFSSDAATMEGIVRGVVQGTSDLIGMYDLTITALGPDDDSVEDDRSIDMDVWVRNRPSHTRRPRIEESFSPIVGIEGEPIGTIVTLQSTRAFGSPTEDEYFNDADREGSDFDGQPIFDYSVVSDTIRYALPDSEGVIRQYYPEPLEFFVEGLPDGLILSNVWGFVPESSPPRWVANAVIEGSVASPIEVEPTIFVRNPRWGYFEEFTFTVKINPLTPGADFDLDGASDIIFRDASGEVHVWSGIASDAGPTQTDAIAAGSFRDVTYTDFDSDGRADLLAIDDSTQYLSVWLGAEEYETRYTFDGWTTAGLRIIAVADFDGDGTSDIVLSDDATGKTVVFILRFLRSEYFGTLYEQLDVREAVVLQNTGTLRVVASPDMDANGQDDLIWTDTANGTVVVQLMSGSLPVEEATFFPEGTTLRIAGLGDFNGDGRTDILWVDTATGEVVGWLMDGIEQNGDAVTVLPGALEVGAPETANGGVWEVLAVSDFNNDTRADIMWRHRATGEVRGTLMDGFSRLPFRPATQLDPNDIPYWRLTRDSQDGLLSTSNRDKFVLDLRNPDGSQPQPGDDFQAILPPGEALEDYTLYSPAVDAFGVVLYDARGYPRADTDSPIEVTNEDGTRAKNIWLDGWPNPGEVLDQGLVRRAAGTNEDGSPTSARGARGRIILGLTQGEAPAILASPLRTDRGFDADPAGILYDVRGRRGYQPLYNFMGYPQVDANGRTQYSLWDFNPGSATEFVGMYVAEDAEGNPILEEVELYEIDSTQQPILVDGVPQLKTVMSPVADPLGGMYYITDRSPERAPVRDDNGDIVFNEDGTPQARSFSYFVIDPEYRVATAETEGGSAPTFAPFDFAWNVFTDPVVTTVIPAGTDYELVGVDDYDGDANRDLLVKDGDGNFRVLYLDGLTITRGADEILRTNADLSVINNYPIVPPALSLPAPSLWSQAIDVGDGWKWVEWFGYFNDGSYPWHYHLELGWFYTDAWSTSAMWLWDVDDGWRWTNRGSYPYLYRPTDDVWLFFLQGNPEGERWFYNFGSEEWEYQGTINGQGSTGEG